MISKLTRKRYKEELSFNIPPADLAVLLPIKAAVLQAFEDDSLIEFANSDSAVWESIKTTFSKLPISTKLFRIFVLQAKYGHNSVNGDTDPSPDRPCKMVRPTIPTSLKTASSVHQLSLPVIESRSDAHLPLRVTNSDLKVFNLRKCNCNYAFGGLPKCECFSVVNEYLVPAHIRTARQREQSWEFLTVWQPFVDGSVAPEAWIPRWPFSLWSAKCYTCYFESRAHV